MFLIRKKVKGFNYYARVVLNNDASSYELFWEGLKDNSDQWEERPQAEEWVKIIQENEPMQLKIIES